MISAQVQRFAGVGVIATLAHLAVALIARDSAGLSAQHANLAGFCAAFGLSYLGHAHFTFRVVGHHSVHFTRFILMSFTGLILSAALTYLIHGIAGAPFAAAMAAVAICVPVFTYLSGRFWVFAAAHSVASGAGYLAALAFGLGYFALLQGRLINHDTAWYLVATRKWLDGARLYVDLIEVNPPLNFYYTVPAIRLADGLGLSDIQGQFLVISGLITASLMWVWSVLNAAPDVDVKRKWILLAGTAFALSMPFLRDYGQREHLLAIVLMPWLVAQVLDLHGGRTEAARAAFAGLGLCLKPHFMLIVILLTVSRCVRDHSVRPVWSVSNLVVLGMGLTYVAAVKVVHPEYLDTIVPIATQVYGGYGFSAAQVIAVASPVVLVSFLIVAFLARQEPTMPVLLVAVSAFVLVYLTQGKGFGYQIVPAFAVIVLACIWVLATPQQRTPARMMAAICLGLISVKSVQPGLYRSPATEVFQPYIEAAGNSPRLALFSSTLWPSFPLVLETQAEWTSRYPSLWLIPGALNRLQGPNCTQGCPRVEAILADTRRDIVSDFVDGAADVLIIDQNPFYIDDPDFNYVEFLSVDPRFTPHFARYVEVDQTHGFTVYRRTDGDAEPRKSSQNGAATASRRT